MKPHNTVSIQYTGVVNSVKDVQLVIHFGAKAPVFFFLCVKNTKVGQNNNNTALYLDSGNP